MNAASNISTADRSRGCWCARATGDAGQPLLELDGAQAAGDVAYARQRLAMVEQQLAPSNRFRAWRYAAQAEAQRAAFWRREQRRRGPRRAAGGQHRDDPRPAGHRRTAATIAREDRDRAQRLFAAEAVTRSSLNQREQILNDAEGRVAALRNQLGVAGGGLSQADSEAASVRSRQAVDLYQEGNTLELQNIEANVLLKRALARTDRLTVRSPVDGIVKVVPVAPGSVVPPGGLLAVVVPTNESWWSRRRSRPPNARPARGLAAHVRITGFDLPGKGWIDGRSARSRPPPSPTMRPAFLQGAHRAGRQISSAAIARWLPVWRRMPTL
jgi:adhesin transport system membrane fusion protein